MIKNILFDFDGVILNSMEIRSSGFEKIFSDFDYKIVSRLLDYHNKNGGLSRYVKIKYFYNVLLNKEISEEEIKYYADSFSNIMRKELINPKYLIATTLTFIKNFFEKYNFHIVSGSDEKELIFLCKELKIEKYFRSINGSPTHKNELVRNILSSNGYNKEETILIGDSINDYEAARINMINFYGFNNIKLAKLSTLYLKDYRVLS